jgi:hypothetical protein
MKAYLNFGQLQDGGIAVQNKEFNRQIRYALRPILNTEIPERNWF